jgi:S1/P1 Nuclease
MWAQIDWHASRSFNGGCDLSEIIAASDRATWTATTVEVWAGESYAIAREKHTEYCMVVGNKCVYEPGNETYDPGETEKVVLVDDSYLERQEPIVTERLKRAGVRLAFLLNTTLGK